ncbi:hypothetical protein F0L74_21955 [Chitinophaga agrisoli]|uniref:BZIP transcription factor n=1 Tax=Chitinophaga agrisoli TaxID=2607653 RepID=A0A5B2VII4_9BACT|nr:hypothetical protein [Chitinophaga agrisoli]KAA2238881.1 hypothetical protein F0L74_21955 [Chitinophaga agrisoli]
MKYDQRKFNQRRQSGGKRTPGRVCPVTSKKILNKMINPILKLQHFVVILLLSLSLPRFVNAQGVVAHTLPNVSTNAGGWYKIGTLTIPQNGQDAIIRIASGVGYNANIDQNGECFIHFRTSNGSSAINGFMGAATFYCTGRAKIVSALTIKQITPGQFEFYAILPQYTGTGSPLITETTTGTWAYAGDRQSAAPEGYQVKEELVLLSPGAFIGNIGLGTYDTKGYRLAVNGDAIFTKIKVKTFATWPDYVFEENYALPSLAEVGRFIKDNKHLPDLPSAAEVQKEGMDVEEMNRKLLQKVEELTLYIIQLNEKNNALENRLTTLEKKQQGK